MGELRQPGSGTFKRHQVNSSSADSAQQIIIFSSLVARSWAVVASDLLVHPSFCTFTSSSLLGSEGLLRIEEGVSFFGGLGR